MRQHGRSLLLWGALCGTALSQTVVTLDARGAANAPLARLVGATAGDVYGKFPAMEVVVFTVSERGKPHRVGRVATLPAGATQPFLIEPGPAAEWRPGEASRVAGVLSVGFAHQAGEWSATLAVQASETTPWIDVLTTVENRSKRMLEVPAVDGVTGPRDAKLARDSAARATVIGAANGATLAAWTPNGPSLLPAANGPGAWFVALPSSDPLPGVFARAGKRLAHFGRSDTFWPLAPEGEWDAEQRNRKHWHRIPAGGSRTMMRRYAVAPAGAAMPATLQLALAAPMSAARLPPGPTRALAAKPTSAPPAAAAPLPAAPPAATPVVAAPPTRALPPPPQWADLPLPPALAAPPEPPRPAPLKPAAAAGDPNMLIVVPADDGPLALPPLPPAKR